MLVIIVVMGCLAFHLASYQLSRSLCALKVYLLGHDHIFDKAMIINYHLVLLSLCRFLYLKHAGVGTIWPLLVDALVGALLNNFALFHHNDLVSMPDSAQSMSDHDRSDFFHHVCYHLLHLCLFVWVQGRGGLIKNEQLWILDNGASQGNLLFLPIGQLAIAKQCLDSLWQLLDKVPAVCLFKSIDDFLFCGVRLPHQDIVLHTCVEEDRLLLDIANLFAQFAKGYLLERAAINDDFTLGRVVESLDQLHDSTFTAAGWAHDCRSLPRLELAREVVEDLGCVHGRVKEVYFLEFDLTCQLKLLSSFVVQVYDHLTVDYIEGKLASNFPFSNCVEMRTDVCQGEATEEDDKEDGDGVASLVRAVIRMILDLFVDPDISQ